MRTWVIGLLALATTTAQATLAPGAKAPDFSTQASKGGQAFSFHLEDALKQGPVVLYFYPAAFTRGCTIEAHEFAEATPKFAALHATVIGVSRDGIDVLNKFSVSECRSKFAVAADPDGTITQKYDAVMQKRPSLSDRTSYVIAPTGDILMAYSALAPDGHVDKTMAAVKAWDTAHPTP